MTDSIIDQAAQVLYRHHVMAIDGGTASSSRAECSCGHTSVALGGARDLVAKRHDRHITEALAKAGLLRPEIDDAMIERAYEAFVRSNPDLGEDVGLVDIEAALEAALGGEW